MHECVEDCETDPEKIAAFRESFGADMFLVHHVEDFTIYDRAPIKSFVKYI